MFSKNQHVRAFKVYLIMYVHLRFNNLLFWRIIVVLLAKFIKSLIFIFHDKYEQDNLFHIINIGQKTYIWPHKAYISTPALFSHPIHSTYWLGQSHNSVTLSPTLCTQMEAGLGWLDQGVRSGDEGENQLGSVRGVQGGEKSTVFS